MPGAWSRDAYAASVGRWQRLNSQVTWVTRLEIADLRALENVWPGISGRTELNGLLPGWGETWRDLGHSVTVETGLAIHPPVRVGVAPYIGGNVGFGVARWGDEHLSYFPDGYVASTTRGRVDPAFVVGVEVGLRLFPSGHWPSACAALGFRTLEGPHGAAGNLEPAISIGY